MGAQEANPEVVKLTTFQNAERHREEEEKHFGFRAEGVPRLQRGRR